MQIWPLQGFWLFETLSTAHKEAEGGEGGGRIPPILEGGGGGVETG